MHVNRKCALNVQSIYEYRIYIRVKSFSTDLTDVKERHKTIYTLIDVEYETVELWTKGQKKHHINVRKLHFRREIPDNFIIKRLPTNIIELYFINATNNSDRISNVRYEIADQNTHTNRVIVEENQNI